MKIFENFISHTPFFWSFQSEETRQLPWEWGFISGPTEEDPQSESESSCHSSYYYAETVIVSDSEDDLSFLDGELATTCHFK